MQAGGPVVGEAPLEHPDQPGVQAPGGGDQKALAARIPVIAAVSAPSSLAVALAEESKMTLVGFLRGETMSVYGERSRVA